MPRSPHRLLSAVLAATACLSTPPAIAGGQSVPPLPDGVAAGPVTLAREGRSVTVGALELWRAEHVLRAAPEGERARVLASMDEDMRTAVVWDLTTLTELVTVSTVTAPGPCRDIDDCERGVGADPEPPADPPSTTLPPPPAPEPTCQVKEDVRRLESGLVFKTTAFRFHQVARYCATGLLIDPLSTSAYSFNSDVDTLWQCQDPEMNFNVTSISAPNLMHAHSSGHCWWEVGIGPVAASAGHAAPFIADTYRSDGERVLRTGSSH